MTVTDAARRGIAVTISFGEQLNATQAVFRGTVEDVRRDVRTFFGMENANDSQLSSADVVTNATQHAHAQATVVRGLDARVIGVVATAEGAHEEATPRSADPWVAASAQAQKAESANPVLGEIERAADIPALRQIWARNQDAFADPVVATAWKTRGRALQHAA